MNCTACRAPNDDDARFCEACGSALVRRCGSCDTEFGPAARFCKGCGTPVDGAVTAPPTPTARRAVRKTVTVLFADLGNSTAFGELVDPETNRAVMARYHGALREIAEVHGAGIVKFAGDGVMAVWGVPEVRADDAQRAVRAGRAMQESFSDVADDAERHGALITLRVAVNTGEVVVGDDDEDIVGDALNVAARLEKECPAGCVVAGDETWRATRDAYAYESMGEVVVKGRTAPVGVHRLEGDAAPEQPAAFVGRAAETATIQQAFDEARSERAVRLVNVVGEPGVGKTTLAREATDDLDAASVTFSCTAEGRIALGPIVEVLRTIVDDGGALDLARLVPEDEADRDAVLDVLTDLVRGGAAHTVEETFRALRRLVEVTATERPLVIVIDDIQWADPLLLDLVEHLVEWVRDSPLLLLTLARPEIRDVRPTMAEPGRWVDVAIALDGLDPDATRALASTLLDGGDIPDELATRLPDSTRGNPLFVRELVRMLVHDGVLRAGGDRWHLTVDVDAIDVPPTVHSLLSTRIERLDDDERRLVEVAAVIGTEFDIASAARLAQIDQLAVLPVLERLRRLQLVDPAGTYVGDAPVWRFHHVLIRDVAYRRLLKADRAELHEGLAERVAGDEAVARHLEAAHRYRVELGEDNAHVRSLGRRAAERYRDAARRALGRDELTSAAALASRDPDLAGDPTLAAELATIACEATLSLQDARAGEAAVARLAAVLRDGDPWLVVYQAQHDALTNPDSLPEAEASLGRAIDAFADADDQAGLAKAHLVRARVRGQLGRIADCESDLDQALVAARKVDDTRRVTSVLGAAPLAALWGPSPVPRAGGRCLDVIRLQRITTAAPSVEAASVRCQAVLEALRGRFDNARSMLQTAHATVRDLGLRHGQAETELFEGLVETIAGDAAAAESHFRAALDGLGSLGVGADASQAAALLATSLLAQGRLDEADRYATEAEQRAGQNLKSAIAWRTARAELLSARGDHDAATRLAQEAVEIGDGTDVVLDHAGALVTLSRVLAAAGDAVGAARAREGADRLYRAKEAEALVGHRAPNEPASDVRGWATGHAPDAPSLTNTAVRRIRGFVDSYQSGDIDAVMANFAEDVTRRDLRRPVSGEIAGAAEIREAFVASHSVVDRVESHTIAVRGDRLALQRIELSSSPTGPAIPFLLLVQTSDAGRIADYTLFDPDDQRAAVRELNERYYAGEGAAFAEHGRLAIEWIEATLDRDRERFLAILHDDFVTHPHNQVFDQLDAEGIVDLNLEVLGDAPAELWNSSVEWLTPSILVSTAHRRVERDDQVVEWEYLIVAQFRDGRFWRLDSFDPHDMADVEQAWALARRLAAQSDRFSLTNAADRVTATAIDMLRAGDPDLADHFSEGFERIDHRSVTSTPVQDRETFIASVCELHELTGDVTYDALAVRGERLVVHEFRWAERDGFGVELLALTELGDDGRIVRMDTYDLDDLRSATAELNRRYLAGDLGGHDPIRLAFGLELVDAIRDRDADRLEAMLHEDFRCLTHDQPFAPLDRERYIEVTCDVVEDGDRSDHWCRMIDLWSPEIMVATTTRRIERDGRLVLWHWISILRFRDGRAWRLDLFDPEHAEQAEAFLESLMPVDTTPVSAVRVNAATAVVTELLDRYDAGDIDGALALTADDIVRDDRRSVVDAGVSHGEDVRTAMRAMHSILPHRRHETHAVRGESSTLQRIAFLPASGGDDATLEVLFVLEAVDGRITYYAMFDVDDLDAAMVELDRRYYSGEGAACAEHGLQLMDSMAAFRRQDVDAARTSLHPGFVFCRHEDRLFHEIATNEFLELFPSDAGTGKVLAWLPDITWLAPDVAIAPFTSRTVMDDGSESEWSYVMVALWRDGLIEALHAFPEEDRDGAMAFAIGQARATQSLPHAADNRCLRVAREFGRATPEELSRFLADDFRRVDRRRGLHAPDVDVDGYAGLSAATQAVFPNSASTPLAVRGETLCCVRVTFDADGSTMPFCLVMEIDDDHKICSLQTFDGDDVAGAMRELDERYYAGEGAAFAEGGAVLVELFDANCRKDLDRYRDVLSDDFAGRTHTGLSWPIQDRDEHLRLNEEVTIGADDYAIWARSVHWHSPSTASFVARRRASTDGLEREWDMVMVARIEDGRVRSLDMWRDLADLDRAIDAAVDLAEGAGSHLALVNRVTRSTGAGVPRAADIEPDFERIDHRRTIFGERRTGRDEFLRGIANLVEIVPGRSVRPIAVRGSRCALLESTHTTDDGRDVSWLLVVCHSERNRIQSTDLFDVDQLDEALVCLDDRYYADEGRAWAAHADVIRRWVSTHSARDWAAYAATMAPDLLCRQHGHTAFPTLDRDELMRVNREVADAADEFHVVARAVDWLADDVVIVSGQRRSVVDGFESEWVYPCVFRIENDVIAELHAFVDDDRDTAAGAYDFARSLIAARSAEPVDPLPVENASSRQTWQHWANWNGADLEAARAFPAHDGIRDDRRTTLGFGAASETEIPVLIDGMLELWPIAEPELLAVRGDRFALWRVVFRSATSSATWDGLWIFEVDRNHFVRWVIFDPDQLAEAAIELDRLYLEHEAPDAHVNERAAIAFGEAMNAGDLERAKRFFAEGAKLTMHTGLGSGLALDGDGWLRFNLEQTTGAVGGLLPVMRFITPDVGVGRARFAVGAAPDHVEYATTIVCRMGDGQFLEWHQWEGDDATEAVRFAEELAAQPPAGIGPLPLSNAATRWIERTGVLASTSGREAIVDRYEPDLVREDRRRLGGGRVHATEAIESALELADIGGFHHGVLAVRGDRFALVCGEFESGEGFTIELLIVTELSPRGRASRFVTFDPTDFDEAMLELDRSYYAGEGAEVAEDGLALTAYMAALRGHDWEALRERIAPGFRFVPRDGTLWTPLTTDEYIDYCEESFGRAETSRAWFPFVEQRAPGVRMGWFRHVATYPDGTEGEWSFFNVGRWQGGRLIEHHMWPAEGEAEAREFADELAARVADPLSLDNLAHRCAEQYTAVWNAGGDLGALLSPDFERVDNRRTVFDGATQGREATVSMVELTREVAPSMRIDEWIAVRGDSLGLARCSFEGDAFTIEALFLTEFDVDGLAVASELFDPDDVEAAMVAVERRYYAGEGAEFARNGERWVDAYEGLIADDHDRYTALYAPGAGFSASGGVLWPGDLDEQVRTFIDVGPVRDYRIIRYPVWRWIWPDVAYTLMQIDAAVDGVDAEWSHISIGYWSDGRVEHVHQFEIEQADEALAFAEALAAERADPLAIANAVTRCMDRFARSWTAGRDLSSFLGASCVLHDHRSGAARSVRKGVADVDDGVEALRARAPRLQTSAMAVRGDRVALIEVTGGGGEGAAVEQLWVLELDPTGAAVAIELFDACDIDRAMLSLERRYYAGEGEAHAEDGATWIGAMEGLAERDPSKWAAMFAEDTTVRFHGGLLDPDLTGEQQTSTMFDQLFQAEEWAQRWPVFTWLGPDSGIARCLTSSVQDGVAAEWDMVVVGRWRDGRPAALDAWPIEQADEAKAHAEDLSRRSRDGVDSNTRSP